MRDRRDFIAGITLGLLAAPLAAEAQQAGRPHKIAYLANSAERTPVDAAFLDALRELGYVCRGGDQVRSGSSASYRCHLRQS